MRKLFLVLVLLGLVAPSCKKYKLKQPAFLHFKWDFYSQVAGPQPVISAGYFYIDKVSVNGTRAEGPDVDIQQSLPVVKTNFEAQGDLKLSVDVPVGDYTAFQVKLNVVDDKEVSLVLRGAHDFGSGPVPFRIEWISPVELSFSPPAGFSLDKKKDYTVTLALNVGDLLEGLDSQAWQLMQVTEEGGVGTIVSREGSETNKKLFLIASGNLKESLSLTVEPQ